MVIFSEIHFYLKSQIHHYTERPIGKKKKKTVLLKLIKQKIHEWLFSLSKNSWLQTALSDKFPSSFWFLNI